MVRASLAVVLTSCGASTALTGLPSSAPAHPEAVMQSHATWTDESGATVAFDQLRGEPFVLAPFYTSCTNRCPMTVEKLTEIDAALTRAGRRVPIVLVTLDPEQDTVHKLREYKAAHHLSRDFHLVRGSRPDTNALAKSLGLRAIADGADVDHDVRIAFFDATGHVVHLYSGWSFDTEAAVRGFGERPASPPVARSAPSGPAAEVEDAPGDVKPLAIFPYSGFGYAVEGGLPLGSVLRVDEVACARNDVTHTWSCAPGKGVFDVMTQRGSVGGLGYDTRRTSACFRVERRRADAAVVKAVTDLYDQRADAPRRARAEEALRAHDPGVATLVAIRLKAHEPGAVCRCEGLDCCLGMRFTAAEVRAGHDQEEVFAWSSNAIAVPADHEVPFGTIAVYDVTPHAADFVALARRGDWPGAVAIASHDLARPDALPPKKRSLAWANLVVAAFQARDMDALGRASAALATMGASAHPYAKSIGERMGLAAHGMMWLGSDPCAGGPPAVGPSHAPAPAPTAAPASTVTPSPTTAPSPAH